MTAPEVTWTLDQLGNVVASVDQDYGATVRRVDRDESAIYSGGGSVDMSDPKRTMTGDLQRATFIGATLADRQTDPVGTEYDHRLTTTVGVRVVGLHWSEHGEIDPDGDNGVPFDELVRRVRDTVLAKRTYPDAAGGPDTEYHSLTIQNEAPDAAAYGDLYRTDFDVAFEGFRDLP